LRRPEQTSEVCETSEVWPRLKAKRSRTCSEFRFDLRFCRTAGRTLLGGIYASVFGQPDARMSNQPSARRLNYTPTGWAIDNHTDNDYTLDMDIQIVSTHDAVLQTISHWTPTQRFALVQEVLKTLEPPALSPTFPKRHTLDKALGLLKTDRLSPTDEEVGRILHESRLEKYA
jgi:hypothetical protein